MHIRPVCLCVAGCNIDIRNSDNIRADITALKYGHNEIADLFDRLRTTGQRDSFARQLVPTSKPAVRLLLRVLGNCGVGKTSLAKSLGAGLFSSLFRRSSSLQSNKSRPSSPINTQIEMDVATRQSSLTFETSANYQSTKGIHVQTLDISNVGEVIIFEYSGQENYFSAYHHLLWPSSHILTLILFSLEDTPAIQVQQVCFWLNFLMSRQPAGLHPSEYGPLMLVATHVDTTRAAKTQHGEWISPDAQKTWESARKLIPHAPGLSSTVLIMDCNVPASYPFKQLKSTLQGLKQDCIQKTIGTSTGLLDATLSWLTTLRKDYEQFPVMYKETFEDLLRTHTNPLASADNILELLQQLHSMGEVFCVSDLIVISLPWFGTQLIGELLSQEFLSNVRSTGVYTADDFQACFNHCDAFGTLELLEALELCVQCEIDGEVEYEFPIYNQTETLPGLWDSNDPRYRTTGVCYGGLRLFTPPRTLHMFTSVFPHIQIELRRAALRNFSNNDNDTDLYQWHHGSKLCTITLETLITLHDDDTRDQCIEIKIRGPRETSQYCFYFLDTVMDNVMQALGRVCPGLIVERHLLSPHQLRVHSEDCYSYPPDIIHMAMLEAESTMDIMVQNAVTDKTESLIELTLFDDADLTNNIQWGCAVKVRNLSMPTKLKLCGLLDPPESHGKDWCLLGLRLGLAPERITALELDHPSPTMRLLSMADCTIGALVSGLHDLGREDAAEVVLRSAPFFKVIEHVNI